VANHLRLLTLPDSIKRLIAEGRLTEGHARALLALDNESHMLEMAERIVRQFADRARRGAGRAAETQAAAFSVKEELSPRWRKWKLI